MDLYTLKHVTLFSTTHSKEQFLKTIETWAEILESAPEGLQGWWYSRDLGFHILQKTLLNGALESCLISLVAAFVALEFGMFPMSSLRAILRRPYWLPRRFCCRWFVSSPVWSDLAGR